MTAARLNRVVQRLRDTAARTGAGGLGDGDLLALFLARRDEAAFAELVRRHGPMVLGVCRRVLGHADDAEDAFQATFLVLIRRAASVRPRGRVGAWLHGVAYRTALEARRAAVRRRAREAKALPRPPAAEDPWDELRPALDRELARLPDKYRVPLLACDVEGQTRSQAAARLGWPEGTVASRLSRARALLARRLTRLGVAGTAAGLTTTLVRSASAALPIALSQSTLKAAAAFAAGKAPAAGSVSAAALAKGVMRTMMFSKLKIAAAVLFGLAITGAGAVGLTYRVNMAGPAAASRAAVPADKSSDAPATLKGADAAGPWGTVEGRVVWAGGDAPAPAPVIPDKDAAACLKNGPIYKQEYVVNPKNKGVRWAVVWLVDADDYKKPPAPIHPDFQEVKDKTVVLDQPCCQFEPHIVCLREGQTLVAKNSGTVPHNTKIDSPGDNPNINPLVPPGAAVEVPGWKAAVFPSTVSCGIHSWMTGYVRVFDHPYFAVTDADGNFRIEKAPAGKFRIIAWQETVGYLDRGLKRGDPVEIKPGGVANIDFAVKPAE